jgi:cell wall-associated NlpC family hydrolase
MFTERTQSTSHRLRRGIAGIALLGVSLAPLALTPTASAGARTVSADSTDTDLAARQVAARRAAEHRRQGEVARVKDQAALAQLAADSRSTRVAPVIAEANAKLGRPYSRGSAGPSAFDCSGLTRWAWQAAGVTLPHYSGAQWDMVQRIGIDELQPGDLVFYWDSGGRGDPGHVGLYVGDGQMIHAPGSGRSVRYESIWYWSGATVAAGRVA